MRIIYELSWLWKTLGILLAALVVCLAAAWGICRLASRKLGKGAVLLAVAAAVVVTAAVVMRIAATPMPIGGDVL